MTKKIRYMRINITCGSSHSSTMVTQGLYAKRGLKKWLAILTGKSAMEWRNLESPTNYTLDMSGMVSLYPKARADLDKLPKECMK